MSSDPWHLAGQEQMDETHCNEYPFQDAMEDTVKGERCCQQSGAMAVPVRVLSDSTGPWPPPAAIVTALGGRGLWGVAVMVLTTGELPGANTDDRRALINWYLPSPCTAMVHTKSSCSSGSWERGNTHMVYIYTSIFKQVLLSCAFDWSRPTSEI